MTAGKVTWIVAILCVLATASVCLWYPLVRINTHQQINYNEGWNAYRQQAVSRGSMLYALPPDLDVVNYPPISFHLIGWVGGLMGDFTAAGRWMSVFSLAAIAILIGLMVREFTGLWRPGIYAAILFITWIEIYSFDRLGMNDPQLFGMVFSVLGCYLYARDSESERGITTAALAFSVGLFIKHSLISIPLAVTIHLLMTRAFRRFVLWLVSMLVFCGTFLFLTIRLDGGYFLQHMAMSRTYSLLEGWQIVWLYLTYFQAPFLIGLMWSIRNIGSPPRNFLAIAFAAANVVGIWFAGGDGVDRNVLFDALVTAAMITGVALHDVEKLIEGVQFQKALWPTILAVPALTGLAMLPTQISANQERSRAGPVLENDAMQAIEFLKRRPGPALCENLLMCFESDKPLLYDAFFVNSQVKTGRMAESDVVRMISSGQFRTIQLDIRPGETLLPTRRLRFTTEVMRAILEHYRPKLQANYHTFLVPKDEP